MGSKEVSSVLTASVSNAKVSQINHLPYITVESDLLIEIENMATSVAYFTEAASTDYQHYLTLGNKSCVESAVFLS